MNFIVDYINPLGQYDQKFGQRYYGKVEDTVMDVSFNLMNPTNFTSGDVIEFEEKLIKQKGPNSKNPGEEYLFLKKVKKASGSLGVPPPSLAIKEATNPQSSKPAADKAYMRDATTIPLDVYRVRANINGLPTNSTERAEFFGHVQEDSEELLNLIEQVRNPGLGAQYRKLQAEKENEDGGN